MSSRYNSKKGNNIINKENDAGPLNIIKKVQPQAIPKKDAGVADKKPVIKQSKSLILQDIKPSENEPAAECNGVEEAKKELSKEERKKDSVKFRRIETDRVMAAYAKGWVTDMKTKEVNGWPKNFLENHRISAGVRAKMVR